MDVKLEQIEEDLTLAQVVSGDRPSIYALGLAVSQYLKQTSMAVLMVDVRGRVRLMPLESVKVLSSPKLSDEELNELSEEDAIECLVAQSDPEQTILEYMSRRKASKG